MTKRRLWLLVIGYAVVLVWDLIDLFTDGFDWVSIVLLLLLTPVVVSAIHELRGEK